MQIKKIKQGFTLVELLVVITIIGILATSWVAVFTTQLQWARDSTRINDMKLFETALHQYFAANDAYPANNAFSWAVEPYMSKTLKDPKNWKTLCYAWATSNTTWADKATVKATCKWIYKVSDDGYGLENGSFKLWVSFEKKDNHNNIAHGDWKKTDWWSHKDMYEVFAWADSDTIDITKGTVYVY